MCKKYSLYFVLFLSISSLSACSSISYFSHLAKGQFDLLWQRQSVVELLASDETPAHLKQRLLLSEKVRRFAEVHLHLPVGNAYSSYTDLGRDFVVWNVYAAPELTLQAYTWCYPLLGCMAYRGYYEEQWAKSAAAELEAQGYEIKVGGVQAYSTLGYFDDPLLNTFIFREESGFIELLLHELAHRKLYIKDDTAFNENFATAVAYLGTQQWYVSTDPQADSAASDPGRERFEILIAFLLDIKDRLAGVYNNVELTVEQKREQKKLIMIALEKDYEALKNQYHWDNRYDRWVLGMNNASFATLSNYQQWVPAFIKLYQQQGQDWLSFYRTVEILAEQDKNIREQKLNALLAEP
jgi:predicted aminopeptidase